MDTTDRTILKRFILGIVAILLIGVIIWIFFFRDDGKKNTNSNTKTDSAAQTTNENDAKEEKQSAQSSSGNQGETAGSGAQNNSNKQPETLTNAGPGNAVLLFAGSATVGTLGHHVIARRRRLRAS